MSSGRTKALFSLSSLPPLFVAGAAACAVVYRAFLTHEGKSTYFVILHIHWLRWLLFSLSFFFAGLISLFFDRRNAGER